jgi:hypothetical protein
MQSARRTERKAPPPVAGTREFCRRENVYQPAEWVLRLNQRGDRGSNKSADPVGQPSAMNSKSQKKGNGNVFHLSEVIVDGIKDETIAVISASNLFFTQPETRGKAAPLDANVSALDALNLRNTSVTTG